MVEATLAGIESARLNRDILQVPVIIELMRFGLSRSVVAEATAALRELTGEDIKEGLGEWERWMDWLAENASEYPPPDGYLKWKITLLSAIDPRFEGFLASADETSRIYLPEVVWGGVPPDGIPDLQNAPVVPGRDADFLASDDRVYGVSINGEHRAYPLRIVNAHEMANDVLGGEPIALAY